MDLPIYFNAHHAPFGAFSTMTLGCKGAKGGLGIELRGPADQNLFIGLEDESPGTYHSFPFYAHKAEVSEADDYDVEGLSDFHRASAVSPFADHEIRRKFGAAIDEWSAGDLTLRIASPIRQVPDPGCAAEPELREALTPAVVAELVVDNRGCSRERKAFFGYAGSNPSAGMRIWREGGVIGIAQSTETSIATDCADAYAGIAWQPESVLDPGFPENLPFLLGNLGMLVAVVPGGELKTIRFSISFFREGTATTGLTTRYLYRRWFDRVEDVAVQALKNAQLAFEEAERFDAALSQRLTPERFVMTAQALRSYAGATQCLETPDGEPIWLVNEGEYRMMNTFDLTVDQAYFELAMNPWTVRNELDLFVERYSYEDEVRFPGEIQTHPGGITFTHDMGIANVFAEPGRSGYEQAGLRGCFSFMSAEELTNWILTACMYLHHTKDDEWLQTRRATFLSTLRSMLNRDHPNPSKRNGVIGLDSSRCQGGSEITTYDSLDASLGQARNNLYLAVKSWAAYLLLTRAFAQLGETEASETAACQADKCAGTILAAVEPDELLPAVLGENIDARIIPAIEGLVYPLVTGLTGALDIKGPFGPLVKALRKHLGLVLDTGVCKFPDGGWRLSSTSENSWLSKIYLCQYVSERVFGMAPDIGADRAHLGWLMDPVNAYYAWSDQMHAGRAVGSRYYPRGVTSILWLSESSQDPFSEIESVLTGSRSEVAAP